MSDRRRFVIVGALIAALAGLAACGGSSGRATSTTTAGDPGAGESTVNIVVGDMSGLTGPMSMAVTPAAVKAGSVRFVVKNTGTIDHEVVVLPTTTPYDKLPLTGYQGQPNRVDGSDSIGSSGTQGIKPGESRSFTIKHMAAGTYALVCNIALHYQRGMRAPFTVTA